MLPVLNIQLENLQTEAKLWNSKKIKGPGGGSGGGEEGGMDGWSTEDFYDTETILYDAVIVDTYHYAFVKAHRMYNTKS